MNVAGLHLRERAVWATAVLPLVGLAALVALLAGDPLAGLGGGPPVEAVAVERTVLHEGAIRLDLRNDGTDPVTIAQVLVNDAYRRHQLTRRTLGRLETATLRIPYPWDEAVPLHVRLVTATGVTFDHDIDPPVETPDTDLESLRAYGLVGVYVGVVPVALGLLWLPSLRRASRRWLTFFLALTAGLLAFLLVDTLVEGLEVARDAPNSLGGSELFAIGALAVLAAAAAVDRALVHRRGDAGTPSPGGGLRLAYLVAGGIGLHNFGEGLAIGAAVATGELGLGTALVIGFAAHNTTEGLAIAAPLGEAGATPRPLRWHLPALVAVAGGPTVLGAWGGGLAFSPAWASLAFGLAAGAIVHVLWAVGRPVLADHRRRPSAALGFVAGLGLMYLTGLLAS